MKDVETKHLVARFDAILDGLRLSTNASRCTVRIDDSLRGWHVDYVVAESVAPGVASLRGVGGIDQRAADTVKWLEAHRRPLIQPNLSNAPDPAPPAALLRQYGVTAQMLAPIGNGDITLPGWLSVHYVDTPPKLTPTYEAALQAAAAAITAILPSPGKA